MRKLLTTTLLLLSVSAFAGQFAKEANDNPFLNGQLNPKYEGELTALSGDIVEIVDDHKGKKIYKINLNVAGIIPIWVTSFAPFAEGEISLNSKLVFRGYIAASDSLDPTGQLRAKINCETLLLALQADSIK